MTTDSTPRERPILFTGEMVRAILAGRKTQTRRPVKPQPEGQPAPLTSWSRSLAHACRDILPDAEAVLEHAATLTGRVFPFRSEYGGLSSPACPYGAPGDRLWVRETWQQVSATPLPARGGPAWPGIGDRVCGPSRWNPACRIIWRADGEMPGEERWRSSIHMPRWASRLTLEVTEVRVERVQAITEEDAAREGVERREHFCRAWSEMYRACPFVFDADPWVWVVSFQRARRGEEGR